MDKQALLEHLYDSSFNDEFEKIARTAAGKAISRGLSPEALSRWFKVSKKPVHVKHVGQGAAQQADVVVHPKFGLSVQKQPLKRIGTRESGVPRSVPEINPGAEMKRERKTEFAAYQHIANLIGKKKNVHIAKPKGQEGVKHYHEYIEPAAKEEAFRKSVRGTVTSKTPLWQNPKSESLSREDLSRPFFNKPTTKVMRKFRKTYPRMGDIRRGNIVAQKGTGHGYLVDFEPGPRKMSWGQQFVSFMRG